VTSESLSALVAALLSAAIGLSVYLEDRRRPPYRTFALLCFNLFAYHLANFVGLMLADVPTALISYLMALGIPLTLLRFTRAFLSDDPAESPSWDVSVMIVSVLMGGVVIYLVIFPHAQALEWFKAVVFIYVMGGVLLSTIRMYRRFGSTPSDVERTRLRYLIVGQLITLLALVGAYVSWSAGTALPALGILFTTLYLYFLSQNLFLPRLLDLQEVLARLSIMALMVLMLSILYGVMLAWVDTAQRSLFMFNTIIASVIVLILIDPLRSTIEERVNQYLFREKFELSQHLLELNREIRHVIDIDELASLVMDSLKRTRRVTHAALHVAAEDGSGFNLRDHLGPRPPDRLDAATNAHFLERLKSAGLLVLESLIMEREALRLGWETPTTESDQALDAVIRSMEELGAGACIPLTADEQLLGLLSIRDDRLREAYSSDELDLIKGVAGQIAVAMQSSRIFQALAERDRLAVLGQMSAGLAHEIRNPLGAIKGAAQYLRADPEDGDSDGDEDGDSDSDSDGDGQIPSEMAEFLDIIIEEVDRLNRVVSQFLDYARPDHGQREQLQMNDVVKRSVQMLGTPADDVELRLDLDENLPPTKANPEQLHQVFLNLGQNALQSMNEGGGRLTIATRTLRRGRPRTTWIEISFKDAGEGISRENIRSLFIPFFTTKSGGTGLGLSISQRIAENHGGTIRVHSIPGKGSTFTLTIPHSTGESTTAG
jgi:two-component system, NtrC family, sensor histidine kinase HydH